MIFLWQCLALFLFISHYAHADSLQKSWVNSANTPSTDFPLQNLPYGVFKSKANLTLPRICMAIGDYAIDLHECVTHQLLKGLSEETLASLQKESLNEFMSLNVKQQHLLRHKMTNLLAEENPTIRDNAQLRNRLLIPRSEIDLLMPVHIGDYTDFYASLNHATHVGSLMRPDNPLMPNYRHMPIGYHGRSSSVVISETPVRWPSGQALQSNGRPEWNLCQALDYELEMGAIIGNGNAQGSPIAITDAPKHIFGFVLLNDWSARDIQKWEYQPLGPFNGKNFATTISPWIVSLEALAPFQTDRPVRSTEDPSLLDYLDSQVSMSLDIIVEAYISSLNMRKANIAPMLICTGNTKELYWTFDQMITHHTSSGCNLRPGDLLGSGTISGATESSLGCLLERGALGLGLLELPDGSSRKYLQDGDEIILRAYTQKEGYPRIGFGECRGIVSKK